MERGANSGGWDHGSLEQVREWADREGVGVQEMEHIREVTLSRAADGRLPAKLSLQVNARTHGDGPWDRARELSVRWQDRSIEQIGLLRRAKNITAPLERLRHHLPPGPLHDLALEWLAVRRHMP
ncbi:hypothetical protein AB0D49_21215 [Streptomyces sp. NPDC048290]|uniref:hypothetical protein n=1 Tax=Streptomyces sp. NPDC048290 TaxID=3155811 RepID=UPI0034403BFA